MEHEEGEEDLKPASPAHADETTITGGAYNDKEMKIQLIHQYGKELYNSLVFPQKIYEWNKA